MPWPSVEILDRTSYESERENMEFQDVVSMKRALIGCFFQGKANKLVWKSKNAHQRSHSYIKDSSSS